jgi:glycosyltransferase involved in cell wall biosynthesis
MRLAFLTHEPFHPPSGGGSAEAPYLLEEFVRRGHEVHLFGPDFPDREKVASRFGITVHPFTRWAMGRYTPARNLKYLLYPGALVQLAEQVLAQYRQQDPSWSYDLIFAQHTISAVAAGRLRRRWQKPIVLNFLDYLTGFMETWPVWVMPRPVVRALTRFELTLPRRFSADGVLTVSTPLAERFRATGLPAERVQPIQYGFDAKQFQPARTRPSADAPVILMHGSFDEHHLGRIARDTVCRVAAARPEVVFRFVGRETPALQRFSRDVRTRQPGIRLELTGFIPYVEVAQQVQQATVGLVPYEESNGTHCAFVAKAVEYLGCGVPVASTPLENLQRYFGHELAVRFSPTFDGAGLAAVVLAWLETPDADRQRWGQAASERVAQELDWSVVTRRAADFTEAVQAGRIGVPTTARVSS